MSFQPGAQLYTMAFGLRPENVEVPTLQTRNPATTDTQFPIGKRWINTTTPSEWVLGSLSSFAGVTTANWLQGGSTGITTLTGDTGGAVGASAGNINIKGGTSISVTGNPGTNTLTVAYTGSSGGQLTFNDEAANFNAIVNNGYFVNGGAAGTVVASLPSGAAQSNQVFITISATTGGSVAVTAPSGQSILVGTVPSGGARTFTSNVLGSNLQLVYQSSSSTWIAISFDNTWTAS